CRRHGEGECAADTGRAKKNLKQHCSERDRVFLPSQSAVELRIVIEDRPLDRAVARPSFSLSSGWRYRSSLRNLELTRRSQEIPAGSKQFRLIGERNAVSRHTYPRPVGLNSNIIAWVFRLLRCR